jgi:hypothetical protein
LPSEVKIVFFESISRRVKKSVDSGVFFERNPGRKIKSVDSGAIFEHLSQAIYQGLKIGAQT